MKEVIIVSGLSGSGKSVVINALEDQGYFCMDNVPPQLIENILTLMDNSASKIDKIALCVDLRSIDFFGGFEEFLSKLRESKSVELKIIFLEASDEVLVGRFKEVRRSHPLSLNIVRGIAEERKRLAFIRGQADFVIDTSDEKASDLKKKVAKFLSISSEAFTLYLRSFGFKHGIPLDSDIVFDLRFLPNPFYIEELRPLTGLDDEVYTYVFNNDEAKIFLEKIIDFLEFTLEKYEREGRHQVNVSIGCTGGQHRSISFVRALNQHFCEKVNVSVEHRDS